MDLTWFQIGMSLIILEVISCIIYLAVEQEIFDRKNANKLLNDAK